jgi:hypothetical protein
MLGRLRSGEPSISARRVLGERDVHLPTLLPPSACIPLSFPPSSPSTCKDSLSPLHLPYFPASVPPPLDSAVRKPSASRATSCLASITRVRTTARRARRTMLARSRSCLPLTLTLASSGPNPTLARLNPNPNPASRPDCNPNFTLSLIYNPNPNPNPITNPNQVKIVHYTCGPKPWGYPRARLQRCAANSGHCTGMAPCLADWTMRWYVARDEVCRAWQTAVRLPPPDGCT